VKFDENTITPGRPGKAAWAGAVAAINHALAASAETMGRVQDISAERTSGQAPCQSVKTLLFNESVRTVFLVMLAVGLGLLAVSLGFALQDTRPKQQASAPSLHDQAIDCGPSHGSTITCTDAHGCTVAAPSEGCDDTVVDTKPLAGTYRYDLAPTGTHPYATRQQITLALEQAPTNAQLAPGVTAGKLRTLVPLLPSRFLPALNHLYLLPALPIGTVAGGLRELPGDVGVVLGCRTTGTAITCQALAPGDQSSPGDAVYRLDWAQSRGVTPPPPGTARKAYDDVVSKALGGRPSAAEAAVLAWLLPRPPAA
jgi:hypothetical protein